MNLDELLQRAQNLNSITMNSLLDKPPSKEEEVIDLDQYLFDLLFLAEKFGDPILINEIKEIRRGEYKLDQADALATQETAGGYVPYAGSPPNPKGPTYYASRSYHQNMMKAQSAKRVLQSIIDALSKPKTKSRLAKLGRPHEAKYIEGQILFQKKTCDIPNGTYLDDICKIMFGNSSRVGYEVEWKNIFRELYDTTIDQDRDWRKIDQHVRAIRKKTESKDMPTILEFVGGKRGKVRRVK